MDRLAEWRDVAYRVLRTAGWQVSCTYADTMLPKADETTRIAGSAGDDPVGIIAEEWTSH